MEEVTNKQGTGLCIGALVTGIIAFLMAVIPCIGIIAIIPAIIAIVLAIVGLSRASNNNGMLIGGLVIGIIALMISLSQTFIISKIADHSDSWANDIEKAVKEIGNDIGNEFDDNNVSIKINSNGDSVEIKASAHKSDLEKQLDDLESEKDTTKVSPGEK
jgi:hypothetical protein